MSEALTRARAGWLLTLAIAVVAAAAGLFLWNQRPRLSETEVRDVVYSTIQRESPASFLVTGELDVTATTRVENSRTLLPGIIGLGLGTTTATVRVPARISYGFDVRRLTPEMIRLVDDTIIEVQVPAPVVYATTPNLAAMEVETSRGWARLSEGTTEQVRQRAIELVQPVLLQQGEAHLRNSAQPRVNTANALEAMLRPVLIAAGIPDPRLRFRIGGGLVVDREAGR